MKPTLWPGHRISHSRPTHARRRLRAGLAGLALGFLALAPVGALAQSDDFADGNDDGWTRYDPLSAFGAPATYSFPGGAYRIQSAASPSPGTLGPGRAGSVRQDVSYGDFEIRYDLVNWDNSLDQAFGLLARAGSIGLGTTVGYAFTYATDGNIDLSSITGENPSGLDDASITLNPANDYRFIFTGVGSTLTGVVYDLADLSTPLATVSATDSTFASGFGGLLVFDDTSAGSGLTDATFDNYVAVVPEPSLIALLALGLTLVGFQARRLKAPRA